MCSTMFLLIAMTLVVEYPVIQAQPVTIKHQWPATCAGKSYCDHKPDYYPKDKVEELMEHVAVEYKFGNFQNRSGSGEDIASCERYYSIKQIYLIKDVNDEIRFVPQTDHFKIEIAVEECKHPGRVIFAEYLPEESLETNEVHCVQTLVPFVFPVVSHDKKSLESAAPKDGISLGCSGKVIK